MYMWKPKMDVGNHPPIALSPYLLRQGLSIKPRAYQYDEFLSFACSGDALVFTF